MPWHTHDYRINYRGTCTGLSRQPLFQEGLAGGHQGPTCCSSEPDFSTRHPKPYLSVALLNSFGQPWLSVALTANSNYPTFPHAAKLEHPNVTITTSLQQSLWAAFRCAGARSRCPLWSQPGAATTTLGVYLQPLVRGKSSPRPALAPVRRLLGRAPVLWSPDTGQAAHPPSSTAFLSWGGPSPGGC